MRTTVTLEPDVEQALRALAHEQGISFKEAINTAVRAGVAAGIAPKPYRTQPRAMGLRPGIDLTHAWALIADLDDEEFLRKRDPQK